MESQETDRRQYQLRLWHVFLWVLASALVLSVTRTIPDMYERLDGLQSGLAARLNLFTTVMIALNSPAYGAVIAGTTISLWQLIRDKSLPVQPGQKLLFIQCGLLLFGLGGSLPVSSVESSDPPSYELPFFMYHGIYALIALAAYAAPLAFRCEKNWKLVFAGISAWQVIEAAISLRVIRLIPSIAIHPFVSWGEEFAPIAGLVLVLSVLMTAIRNDRRDHIKRDSLHCVGVVLEGLSGVLYCVEHIGLFFIQWTYYS